MNTQYTIIVGLVVVLGLGFLIFSKPGNIDVMAEEHHDDDRVESYEIYPGDVADKITNEEDIILLDVRTPQEYEDVHLKNALLLPVQELSAKTLDAIGLGENAKDKEIIIYCRSGSRSKTAYDIMNSLGYTNIKSVAGGMIHWQEDEYPFTEVGKYDGAKVVPQASAREVDSSGAKINLDRNFYDFGEINQYGGTVTTYFTITNTGTDTLTIGNITTSCSCTSADVADKEIAPGEQTKLTVVFDPNFHEEPLGVFKRTVFIPTNDLNIPEEEVTVQVDIIEGK